MIDILFARRRGNLKMVFPLVHLLDVDFHLILLPDLQKAVEQIFLKALTKNLPVGLTLLYGELLERLVL